MEAGAPKALLPFQKNEVNCLLLKTGDVAAVLRVSRRTVCLWAECGVLPAIRVGRQWRFRRDTIVLWLHRHEQILSSVVSDACSPFKQKGHRGHTVFRDPD